MLRIFRGSTLKQIFTLTCAFALACMVAPAILAQRAGGTHVGGGHIGAPQMSAPRAMAPRPAPAAPRTAPAPRPTPVAPHPMPINPASIAPHPAPVMPGFRSPSTPPPAGFGTSSFRAPRPFPIRPGPPPRPTIRPPISTPLFPYPVFLGQAFPVFPGSGFGFGFGGFGCDPFWGWNFGCVGAPFYGYGFENFGPFAGPTYFYEPPSYEGPVYPGPLYLYSGPERELAQLYLKDGTVYNVLDYWLVDDQLHFTTSEGGAQPVEHVIDFSQLDLQKTIDIATQRGFQFVLRDEPMDRYLRDHPDMDSGPAPQTESPAAPSQAPAQQ